MKRLRFLMWSGAFLMAGLPLLAQTTASETEKAESSFVLAPAISSSPGFGNGLGAVGLYFFRPSETDTVSPNSSVTAIGLYSDTDSYFTGAFAKLHLKEDDWRVVVGVPSGRVNSKLNVGAPTTANFENNFVAILLEAQRRITGNWYGGLRWLTIDQSYQAKNDVGSAYFDALDIEDTRSGSLTGIVSYDSRDDQRYPEAGTYGDALVTYAPAERSETGEYYVLQSTLASFYKIKPDQILALQLKGKTVPDDAPYFERPTLGQRGDMRGYTPGEIVGDHMVMFQAEYRMRFTPRFGGVIFGATSGLWEDTFTRDDIYYSYGLGVRIRMNETNRVNFRIDYARGEDDDDGWYVGVSEAF